MSLSIVVNGGGTFSASMEEGPVSFTASLGAVPGPKGDTGATGAAGTNGVGVPVGGTTGQVLGKASATNYDTEWISNNPFDQSLNTTDSPTFSDVTVGGTIIDSLQLTLGGYITFPDATSQNTALPNGTADGNIVAWNEATSAYDSIPNEARTLFATVRNESGSSMAKGTVVYISGASGNKAVVSKALATGDATSATTFAVLAEAIANNSNGRAIVAGELAGLNTSAFADGAALYLSPTTAGTFTTTKPSAPNHLVYVATVTRSHATQGTIEVRIQNGYELEELHNVAIASVANNDLISWDSATSLWKNKTFATLGLLTSSTAASTYAPLASPTFTGTVTIPAGASISGFLTSSTAASTYAPLASPALTGNPTAPTPDTSDNDTSIATTAFVNAFVPAASTTVAGKVELATDAEAVAGTSATLAVTPVGALLSATSPNFFRIYGPDFTTSTSGTGGLNDAFGFGAARRTNGPSSTGAGHVVARAGVFPHLGQTVNGNLNWTRRVVLTAKIIRTGFSAVSTNSIFRITLGEPDASNTGDPSVASIGIKVIGPGAMEILAHDGTTLTTFTTSHTPVLNQIFNFMLVSDGAGNVEAFVNGSSVGSTTGGPTTLLAGTENNRFLHCKVENLSGFDVRPSIYTTYFPTVAVL